jgi:hypothetical protein
LKTFPVVQGSKRLLPRGLNAQNSKRGVKLAQALQLLQQAAAAAIAFSAGSFLPDAEMSASLILWLSYPTFLKAFYLSGEHRLYE